MTIEMLIRTGEALGVEVRPETLMDAPTLGAFCQALDSKKSSASVETQNEAEIVPCPRDCPLPVSFIQELAYLFLAVEWFQNCQSAAVTPAIGLVRNVMR